MAWCSVKKKTHGQLYLLPLYWVGILFELCVRSKVTCWTLYNVSGFHSIMWGIRERSAEKVISDSPAASVTCRSACLRHARPERGVGSGGAHFGSTVLHKKCLSGEQRQFMNTAQNRQDFVVWYKTISWCNCRCHCLILYCIYKCEHYNFVYIDKMCKAVVPCACTVENWYPYLPPNCT